MRRLDTSISPQLIIIDEAHHAVAGSWDKIIAHWDNAKIIGVTATPSRLDGRGLSSHFEALVEGPSVEQLVKHGYLSPHKVFAPPVLADLSSVKTRGEIMPMISFLKRWIVPQLLVMLALTTAIWLTVYLLLLFAATIDHATSVLKSFKAAGYRARLVTGNMSTEERDDAISGLADGRTQVLCSVDVVSEGTDVPAVSAAILLRPTQSEALYLQQVGGSSALNLERSQLFWITLAALSNMALLMTFAFGT